MGNKKKRNKKKTPEIETIEKEDIVPLSEISFWRKLLWWIVGTPKEYRKGPVRDTIEMIIQVVIIVFVVRVVAIEAYKIPTGSMEKTIFGRNMVSIIATTDTERYLHNQTRQRGLLFTSVK